jgi:hypothetical protein
MEYRSVMDIMNKPRYYHVPTNRRQPHEQQWHSSGPLSDASRVCIALEKPILLPKKGVSRPLLNPEQWSTVADRTEAE